jgi:hypothetical protein
VKESVVDIEYVLVHIQSNFAILETIYDLMTCLYDMKW